MAEALSLKLSLDQTSLLPNRKNRCHLVIELCASAIDAAFARPPLTIVFALDRSSSMKGPPIEHVAQSVDRIVDLLSDRDRIGIVSFSTKAQIDMPIGPATSSAKEQVRALVHHLRASKETNMEAGLRLAGEMLLSEPADHRRNRLRSNSRAERRSSRGSTLACARRGAPAGSHR